MVEFGAFQAQHVCHRYSKYTIRPRRAVSNGSSTVPLLYHWPAKVYFETTVALIHRDTYCIYGISVQVQNRRRKWVDFGIHMTYSAIALRSPTRSLTPSSLHLLTRAVSLSNWATSSWPFSSAKDKGVLPSLFWIPRSAR